MAQEIGAMVGEAAPDGSATGGAAADGAAERRVRDSFARQGLMAHLGAELARVAPGVVTIRLPFRPELTQQHGHFHAGGLATVADSAGGYAGLTLFPEGSEVLTVEFKLNLLRPARGAAVEAEGTVIKAGRTLTVCRLEVHALAADGGRTHCATGMQTLIRVAAPAGDQALSVGAGGAGRSAASTAASTRSAGADQA